MSNMQLIGIALAIANVALLAGGLYAIKRHQRRHDDHHGHHRHS